MKFETSTGPFDEFCISAVPAEYDGHPPVARFAMDHQPAQLPADRLAVAAYLLFRPWVSAVVEFPEAVSAPVAEHLAAMEDLAPLSVAPIALRARPMASGRRGLTVSCVPDAGDAVLRAHVPGNVGIDLLRSDQATGAIRTGSRVLVASNTFMLADGPRREAEVAAGVACLLALDLDGGRLDVGAGLDDRVVTLLELVGLRVI